MVSLLLNPDHTTQAWPESLQPAGDCCTRWKSARFRIRTNLESVSRSLQPGLRFFHLPLPAPPTASLAGHLPFPIFRGGRRIGLTVFHANDTGSLGPACMPAIILSMYPQAQREYPIARLFWLKPVSIFGLLRITTRPMAVRFL